MLPVFINRCGAGRHVELIPSTGWSEPFPGRELHPVKSSAFHGTLFRQSSSARDFGFEYDTVLGLRFDRDEPKRFRRGGGSYGSGVAPTPRRRLQFMAGLGTYSASAV